MGMVGEILASIEAERLEKALLNAIALNDKSVNEYCKNNILPMYENAVTETWSKPSDNYKTIKEFFNMNKETQKFNQGEGNTHVSGSAVCVLGDMLCKCKSRTYENFLKEGCEHYR